MTSDLRARIRFSPALLAIIGLVTPAYLSLFLSSPGKVAGDTKLYLYLDPRRLMADSVWSWDSRQFGGWVPHQNVGYLWPTGPWYAVCDLLRIPDWIAQRMWLGTIMVVAGLGCLWLGRRLGLSLSAAFIAAAIYEFSPYSLPYISRTSALLLPWALLPWMCGTAMIAGRRWWAVSAFGFLVLSSGGLNATALLMIAPGPAIWIVHQWRSGLLSTIRTIRTVLVLGAVSLLTSAWWLAGLFVQGRYGAAVLSYSESLVSTAATSSAPEVLRGLGYWLFYDRNEVVALTSASSAFQDSLAVLAAGGALVLLGLWGIVGDRKWRWPLMTMVLAGTALAVGPHPFDDPSPIWSLAVDHPKSALSMALRSSTRAVPLIVLALALGTGALLDRRRLTTVGTIRSRLVPALVLALVVIDAPAVVSGHLIDPAMTRPETLPQAWYDAASVLDERFEAGYTGSVLLVPGIESAAYRWGYPVDPILPGLTKKPFISRDWLPLGSAPMMDLLYALDDSFQSGTASAGSVASVARMLGADTVMVVNSHQYERFGTIRPESAATIFGTDPAGLRLLGTFGPATRNQAFDGELERWSEDLVAHPLQPLPEILLYAVEDPSSAVRVSDRPVVVAADGTGLVELGARGILDGTGIVLAEAALDDRQLRDAVTAAPEVIITDSNRRRAHHWRSSQEVWGASEPPSGVLLEPDLFDSRLPVFPAATDASRSLVDEAPVRVRASSYGPQLSYWPEDRPAMAIDGDPTTAWRVGVEANPVGQMIEVQAGSQGLERLHLIQPRDDSGRWITAIDYRLDDGPWTTVSLNAASRSDLGQIIEFPTSATRATIRIAAIGAEPPFDQSFGSGVGFAEILDRAQSVAEVIRVPRRLEQFIDGATPVSFVFSRWRADPLDRRRQDPETSLQRSFETITTDTYEPEITLRLAPRIDDARIISVLGLSDVDRSWSVVGSAGRLQGATRWWAAAAIDDDPTSAWWSAPFANPADPSGSVLSLPLESPVSTLTLRQVTGGASSTLTRLRLEARSGGRIVATADVVVPPADESGESRLDFPALSGDRLDLVVTGIDPHRVRDESDGRIVAAPVGIVDVASNDGSTQAIPRLTIPSRLSTVCRDDLLSIDGKSVSVRIAGSIDDALAGSPLSVSLCDGQPLMLAAGDHRLETASGLITGWDIDSVVLRDSDRRPHVSAQPLDVTARRGLRSVDAPACNASCWIEFPDGWNVGWHADEGVYGTPLASAAGRNTWMRAESPVPGRITSTWTPQIYLWWGLAISLAAAVVLFALGIADVSGRLRRRDPIPNDPRRATLRYASVPLATLVLGSLLIHPIWGVALGVLGSFLARRPRMLAFVGWTLVGLSMAFLVAQQLRTGAEPGFLWPAVFGRAHRPALAGVTVLWCAVMALDRRRSESR